MKKLVIIGASGHGKVIADIAVKNGYKEIVFLDDNERVEECAGYPVVGKTCEASTMDGDKIIAIGKNKFDLYVLTIRNFTNTAVYKQVHELGIEIIPIYPKWNFLIKLFNKLFGKQYIDYKMRKIITQIRPSCIHAHLYTLDYLFRISSSLHDVKLYYTCHSIPERYFGEKYEKQTS